MRDLLFMRDIARFRSAFSLPAWLAALAVLILIVLFLGALPAIAQPVSGADSRAPGDTLTLDAAVQEALGSNFQIRIARNEAAVAQNNATLGNAGFLPVATADGRASQSLASSTQEFGDTRQTQSGVVTTNYNAGAEARWTVFDGFRRTATYNQLQAEEEQQAARSMQQIEQEVAAVVVAYSDVARLQQQVTVFDESVSISEERLRIARLRKDLGSASDLEVRQAQVDLNTDRADRLRAQADLSNARAQLAQQLGMDRVPTTDLAVSVDADIATDLQEDRLRAMAERKSPAVVQAERAVEVAEQDVAITRGDWFPALDVFGGYSYSRTDGGAGFLRFSEVSQFEYGASLVFTIFDGFNRTRQQENAQVRVRNAEFALSDIQAEVAAGITGAYQQYATRLQVVELERENLEAAAANVDIALERFRLGTITSVELREVQEQRIRAESRLLDARFEAKRAETDLLRLSGQLVGGDALP